MKLMKRILAIVCTFVMIISMATGVNAVDNSSTTATTGTTKTGSITLNNATVGDTYNVYKILSLESYDKDNNAYSYKKTGDKWDDFVTTGKGADFFETNSDKYVILKKNVSNDNAVRQLAIDAIDFVHANSDVKPAKSVTAIATSKTKTTSVVFDGLELGYYVVDSTSGAACAITTTNPDASINNKRDNPSVNKLIKAGGVVSKDEKMNSVNIGAEVGFQTIINVKPGARNYVLHDIMDENLQYIYIQQVYYVDKNNKTVHLKQQGLNQTDPDFVVTQSELGDNCTFELKFTDKFYSTNKAAIDNKDITAIYVEYVAIVKDDAPINTAMKNTTYLTYGDNNLKTDESETETYTYGIPVYKYTGTNKALAGAKFILSKNENVNESNAIKFTQAGEKCTYAADQTSASATITLVSQGSGYIKIQGLEAGTYYLKETEAPTGYNKISEPIKIVVGTDENGKQTITVLGETVDEVKVKNNTGSLLPSTGGMGTTLIYVVGSILVLASGIVLFSKRKEGTN